MLGGLGYDVIRCIFVVVDIDDWRLGGSWRPDGSWFIHLISSLYGDNKSCVSLLYGLLMQLKDLDGLSPFDLPLFSVEDSGVVPRNTVLFVAWMGGL